jgi:3-hydroxyisobutyrate dehydrogenase-like beta-hydroxyacid dehydrogenase
MSAAVGFIGLGNIGAPMARRLLAWPGGLVVHDVRPEATERYVAKGATAAASPAEVARAADVISVMVQNEDQVRDVLSGPDGILAAARPGTVVAVHSTISAPGAAALAATAAAAGVELVDAPVSGGAMGAHDGTLAIMVGGSDAAVEKCREPFALMGSLVAHFGPVGAGTNAKIARNLITFVSFAAAGEAQRLAEAAGLDLTKLGDVVRHSDRVTGGAGAVMLRPTAGRMADDDGLRPIFEHSATLGAKDLHLAVQLADEHGLAAPFAELGERWLRTALGLDSHPDPS